MTAATFWDRLAPRYAARPVDHPEAYAAWLDRVRSHLRDTDEVLEVGCGTGSTALTLAPCATSILATDYAPAMIRIAREKAAAQGVGNVLFEVADATAPQGSFDVVMAYSLLHLLPDTERGIAALAAQVRPGGLLITKTVCLGPRRWLFAPLIGAMRLVGKAPPVRMVHPDRLAAQVRAAGFDILEQGDYPRGGASRFIVARKRGAAQG